MIARVVKYHSIAEWKLLALVRAGQSPDRHLVRHPRSIPPLPLKGDTKMKTTNLKQTSVAKPRKSFQRRCGWHDRREARAERSQFRDQPPSREATRATGGCVYIFVNSRRIREFLPRLRRAQIELHNFSSVVNQLLRPRLARDELIPPSTKGVSSSL